MKRIAIVLSVAALVAFAAAPRVPRAALQSMEKNFDGRIQRFNIDDPVDLLGPTRGIYLEKYGAVFTTEVNLVITGLTPFRPQFTPEELERLRQKKLSRVGEVRKLMRDFLITSGTSLKAVPLDEQVVVGVTFFHKPYEVTTGLPSQLVMQAPRKVLADYEAGRIKQPALEASIQEQVY